MSKATLRIGRCILAEKPKRYRKDAAFSIESARLREIEKIIRERHGQIVPDPEDTDDRATGLAYVTAAALSLAGQDMIGWCRRWAPWARSGEILLIEATARKRRHMMKADGVAGLLHVTMAERDRLELKTIGACDMSKAERSKRVRERKRERDREAKRAHRRASGRQDRKSYEGQSLTRTKPWEAEGMSRRSWYRRRGTGVARVGSNPDGDTLVPAANDGRSSLALTPHLERDLREAESQGVRGSYPRRRDREAEPHGMSAGPAEAQA